MQLNNGRVDGAMVAKLKENAPVPQIPQSGPLAELAREAVAQMRARAATGSWNLDRIAALRHELVPLLGAAGFGDAATVIGAFNGVTKMADMTGVKSDTASGPDGFAPKQAAIDALGLSSWRAGEGVRIMPMPAAKSKL